jgi:hypothetical protein
VAFGDPRAKDLIMIENLADKPPDQTVEQWLTDVTDTVTDDIVSETWVTVDGIRALKVINSVLENIYVVHGSRNFAIRVDRHSPSYGQYRRMLSTVRFTTR